MYLTWIDLEMTGLDPEKDHIVEIAVILTNESLTEMIEGPSIVIGHDASVLENMSEVVKKMHKNSGLYEKILTSNTSLETAEREVVEFLKKYITANQSPLCGNSISTDRAFINSKMPTLGKLLHYRSIDVTSLKLCSDMWCKEVKAFKKKNTHRALDDIKESIEELKYYKEKIIQ